MANMIDYLAWRGDLPMAPGQLNQVDGVLLARLAYLPFEHVFLPGVERISIGRAAEQLLSLPEIGSLLLIPSDRTLLEALKESPRFREMELSGSVNQLDGETQTQFSAITIRLNEKERYVSFRGTDNTLIGWKEDLNMCFVCPVPAQVLAVQYLAETARLHPEDLIPGGHSKGGNLAVYAAAFCPEAVQERIPGVFNFDGPGFDGKVLSTAGYRRICDRVSTFVPQSSVVGMLLGHEEKYTIVHSQQSGLMQHDVYSWDVLRDHFACLETVNSSSRFIDYTLKAWLGSLDYAQREKCIDAVYSALIQTNATTLREFNENWFSNMLSVLRNMKNLDEETRHLVVQTFLLLVKSARAGLSRIWQAEGPEEGGITPMQEHT